MANKIIIELDVDEHGKASAALKSLEGDVRRFTDHTNRAGDSGHKLRDIFTGNLLADFFQRGTSAAVAFTAKAVQASAAASDANRILEFSATQAGLSYTRAAGAAEDFGRRVGASNAEASRTFSDLIRLAERAGRGGDIELIGKRFADLAAARGLRGAELSNLIGTILSGQDEGLNRLGLPDPSKLYAAYASQLGKTADALTETERAQAALFAVMAKGADAEGEAERRLKGTAGQLDTTGAAYENLTVQIGDAITNSVEFRDVLDTVSDALSGLITSHAQARRELAKGLKTPEQIAQEERDSDARQVWNFFKGTVTAGVIAGGTVSGIAPLLGFSPFDAGVSSAIFNPGQRQYDARVAQLKQLQEEIKQQEKEAEEQKRLKGDRAQAEVTAKEQVEAAKKAAEEHKKLVEQVRTARDAVRSFLGDMAQAADKDNPFITLFVRAQVEVEETRRKFLIFGEAFADEMARIKKESIETEIAVARFTSQVQALKNAQEARRLSEPFIGQTGPQERRLDVIGEQIKLFQQDPDLARRQRFLENPFRPFTSRDARRELQGQLSQLLGLDVSGAGRGGREAQSAAILELARQIDPRVLATSADPTLRQLRFASIDALQVQREGLQQNVQDAIARERVGNFIQRDARELLQTITASGLRDDAKVKEFLTVTGALSEKELTPDLRRARVDALREATRIESAKDQDAERRAKKLETFLDRFDRALSDKGIKIDGSTGTVTIEVFDRSDAAKVSTLGEGFR